MLVLGMGLSLLVASLPANATVTSGGGSGDGFTPIPAPESEILLEWDYHLDRYLYIFNDGGDLDEASVTIEVQGDDGPRETLASASDSLYREGDLIIGVSEIQPNDDQHFTVSVQADGDTMAVREFDTSGEEFVPTVGQYSYEMDMRVIESVEDYSMTMEMEVIAEIETTATYELVLMEGQLAMEMDDEGMTLELQGLVEQMSKESDGETVESSMTMDLDGTFSYDDGWISMDGDATMRTSEENQLMTDNYMLMDGEWSGMGDSGDFYVEEKTLRFEDHANHAGDSYDCIVLESYSLMTMGGDKQENLTTSWKVRESGYSNTTIYYEYEEKENDDTTDEGFEYPENSPIRDDDEYDVFDVVELEGATPVIPVLGDVFVGSSETDVDFAVRYEVDSAKGKSIGSRTYNTLIINGEVLGEGVGMGLIYICYDENLAGLTLYQEEHVSWANQTLTGSYTLIQAQVPSSDDGDDDELNLLWILIPLAIVLTGAGMAIIYRSRNQARAEEETEPWEQPPGTPQVTQSIQPQAQAAQFGPQTGHTPYMPMQQYATQPGTSQGIGVSEVAPAATQVPVATCPFCFSAAGYLPQYGYYYCQRCQQYLQV